MVAAAVVAVTCDVNTISQRRSAGEPSRLWQRCCRTPLVRALVVHVAGGENAAAVAAGDREPEITTINTQTQRARDTRTAAVLQWPFVGCYPNPTLTPAVAVLVG